MRGIAVAGILIASTTADAQPSELGLAWQAPATCPDAAGIHRRIEQRLGGSLDDELVSGIDVGIARDHGRFVAHIDLRALTVANDVRTLTSSRCDELADAVAVVVARVARERAVHRPATRTPGAPAPVAAPVASIDRPAVDEPVVSRSVVAERPSTVVAPRTWSLGMRVSGVSGIGIVPEVGLGAEVAITVRRKSASAELAETKWLASGADANVGGPAHVDVGLQVTAARIGWRPPGLPLRAFAAAEAGTMDGIGVGVGVANPQHGNRWFAAGAGFGVVWQMTPWLRLVGTTEVMLAVERVKFALGNGVIVYAPSPMSARASCGLELGWQ